MNKAKRSIAPAVALATAIAAASPLSGCKSVGPLFGPDATLAVSEVGRASSCAAPGADSSVQMFASADAVRAWQQSSGVELIGNQSMLAGTYVLVQLGQRNTGGYGLLIGPEAQVEDRRLRLHATFFEPQAGSMTTEQLTSPCVLVRVPAGTWTAVDVYDQTGARRARSPAP